MNIDKHPPYKYFTIQTFSNTYMTHWHLRRSKLNVNGFGQHIIRNHWNFSIMYDC